MRTGKKIIVGALLMVTLLPTSVIGAYAAEKECDHNWRLYNLEKVYDYSGVCKEHEDCICHIEGYFVRYKCGKCGADDAKTYTEERHLK